MLAYRIFSIKRPLYLKITFWRSGFNRGTALLIKSNFLYFSFFRKTYYFTHPRTQGQFIRVGGIFLSSCPWISEDDYVQMIKYITQRYRIVIRLWYRILCCKASALVMFNTPLFFLWTFITKTTALYLVQYFVKVLLKGLYSYISAGVPSSRYECVMYIFSHESRCRITSDRWDIVWEIKYWGLRTLNIILFQLFIWAWPK